MNVTEQICWALKTSKLQNLYLVLLGLRGHVRVIIISKHIFNANPVLSFQMCEMKWSSRSQKLTGVIKIANLLQTVGLC
jgi:hypothetical protein